VFAEELEGLVGASSVEGVPARSVTVTIENFLGLQAALDDGLQSTKNPVLIHLRARRALGSRFLDSV